MDGHALALFIVENLIAALEELIKLESESTELLLSRLQQEEDELYKNDMVDDGVNFLNYPQELYPVNPNETKIDASLFFKGKNMCHTARLPSQTRYLGYLTNSSNDKVGGPVPFGKETVSTHNTDNDDDCYYTCKCLFVGSVYLIAVFIS